MITADLFTCPVHVLLFFSLTTFLLFITVVYYNDFPIFFRYNIVDKDGNPTPPGPPLPYAFLRKYPERTLDVWAQKYGPLFSVWMGNQLVIVISNPHIARELLVSNGSIFSSRKQYFIKNQTILRGRAITATPYGSTWRHHRKIAMQLLTPRALQGYNSKLDYEAHILIRSLYEDSLKGDFAINPSHHVGRYVLNNMLTICFGTRTDSITDPLIKRALALAMEFMDLTGPLSNAIDFIKPLQWIPTSKRSRGHKLHDDLIEVYSTMILQVKARVDSGESVPDCLVKTLIESQEKEKLDWEDICMLTAVFTLGGVHSTSGLIMWFLAVISSHPAIQARAHNELDRVVGRKNWPTAEDEKQLPYIRAIIKELQRLHAPFWLATPHYSTEDFVYQGLFIPKNSVMILNCFTLHHNEARYPDPYTFNPDRYLGDNLSCGESANLADAMERDHWAFGAGRRICPALVVAERELWLAISQLLWAYDIQPVPGEPISLDEYEGESGRTPLPYKVKLLPRHDGAHNALAAEQEIIL